MQAARTLGNVSKNVTKDELEYQNDKKLTLKI